jgi:8-oxo-dGTP pyrophosphatase MutT (NUDIX family)
MHRRRLQTMLDLYATIHPDEGEIVSQIRALAQARSDCFSRDCHPGHITASAWIVPDDHAHFLLTHHRKLGRWLQLGGHADGDADPLAVALREAREESGMHAFEVLQPGGRCWAARSVSAGAVPIPLDIDVHRIPAHGDEPEHQHHDIRFLLVAAPNQRLQISEESKDLAWFARERLDEVAGDESVNRLGRKAAAWLKG